MLVSYKAEAIFQAPFCFSFLDLEHVAARILGELRFSVIEERVGLADPRIGGLSTRRADRIAQIARDELDYERSAPRAAARNGFGGKAVGLVHCALILQSLEPIASLFYRIFLG